MELSEATLCALNRALEIAATHKHEYATIEHLLAALLENKEIRRIVGCCGGNPGAIKKNVLRYVKREYKKLVDERLRAEDVRPTAGIQRVVERARVMAMCRGDELRIQDVFACIFKEREAPARAFLEDGGVTYYDVQRHRHIAK